VKVNQLGSILVAAVSNHDRRMMLCVDSVSRNEEFKPKMEKFDSLSCSSAITT
jgi:hypothetical protein